MHEIWYVFADASGVITGTGYSPDGTLPSGAIECTQAQYQNTSAYAVDSTTTPPSVVSAPKSALLAQARAAQITILSADYQKAAFADVTDANGAVWNGGESSALSIDGAIRLAQNANLTTVDLWDKSNNMHSLSIAEAQKVAFDVGTAYQTAYQNWQNKRKAVENATTISAVQAIVW